jgi:ABC-type branched-subunit amino acid transport system ATPase component/ABC-type branched-subunit amino acid transport system permease subunit
MAVSKSLPVTRRTAGRAEHPRTRGFRSGAAIAGVLVYLVLTYAVAHSTLYVQGLVLVAAVFAVVALSLDLVLGVTGMFSLAHAGLLGVGAYVTTVLWTNQGINIFLLLPVAVIGSGLFGLVIGAATLRVGGLQFAIVTLIFTLVFTTVVSNLSVTGGADGLLGPTPPDWPSGLGWLGTVTSWTTMIVLLIAIVVVWGIRRSPVYPVLLGIKDAERFAEAAGARVTVIRIGVFALSGALVGLAGWAFSLLGSVSPDEFTWVQSVNVLIMALLGGFNTALGPVIGAAVVSIIPTAVGLQSYVDEVIFGVVMLVVVLAFPKGFAGSIGPRISARLPGLARFTGPLLPGVSVPARPAKDRPARDAASAGRDRTAIDTAARAGAAPDQATAPGAETGLARVYARDDRSRSRVTERPAPEPGTVAVACRDVMFRYPTSEVRALNGIDMTVTAGTIHGLIGPNGSGKSTLIDVISGRVRPESGTVSVNGEAVSGRAFERARLGFMRTFQAATLVSDMSAVANVVMGGYSRLHRSALRAPWYALAGRSQRDYAWLQREALTVLAAVGVDTGVLEPIADVSQNVRQLVQLAAVGVARPSTLVLDEPLAGLSVGEVEQVGRLLRELRALGMTVIIVEHQTQFVFNVCDNVTVLSSGKVVVSGEAAMVRQNERVREVYLGL